MHLVLPRDSTWQQYGLGEELRATRCEIATARDNRFGGSTHLWGLSHPQEVGAAGGAAERKARTQPVIKTLTRHALR